MLFYKTHVIIINSILISASCLTCEEVLEMPENSKLKLEDLQTLSPRDIAECISHLGRRKIPLEDAQLIWYNVVEYHNGTSGIPDDVLCSLRWVTIALTPEDYTNITLNDIDVISNFGIHYGLSFAQLTAIAARVRIDFARKKPEDYSGYDLIGLNQIMCAFNETEIGRIHPKAFKNAAVVIGQIKNCKHEVLDAFSKLAVHKCAFGPFKKWTASTKEDLGIIAEHISKMQIQK